MPKLQKKELQSYLRFAIPLVVFLALGIKLFLEWRADKTSELIDYLSIRQVNGQYVVLVLICAVVNWSLEAWKWRILTKSVEVISFWKALLSVFAGMGLGFFTQKSVGDYFGRVLVLGNTNRMQMLGGLLVNQLSQLLVTIVMGCLGLVYLKKVLAINIGYNGLLWFTILCFAFILILFFLRKKIVDYFFTFRFLKKLLTFVVIIKSYKNSLYSKVALLSVLRYAMFILQYVLVAKLLQFEFVYPDFVAVVCSVLLLKSLVPSFHFFSDLGVRELGFMFLFPFVGIASYEAVVLSLVVWAINMALPSVLGSFVVLKFKY